MICISVAQESRRFALVDMLNAAKQCDLIEVRLDRFGKAPDLGDLIAAKPKPVIMSCRRKIDGGEWDGSEDERLALLRQCIIDRADYVEIERDVADQIRPYPPSQRVITYTNFQETPADIAAIHADLQTKRPDVIKLVTRVRTPEEAWPLVQILARSTVPTVVVGLGKPGILLALLGKKIGAPWTYAALERGMETYPGQPTVTDLNTIYHYSDIGRSTPFVGVTGFTDATPITTALLNMAFQQLGLPERGLPLPVGDIQVFRKVINAVKLGSVVVDEAHREAVLEIAPRLKETAEEARAADLLLRPRDTWYGSSFLGRAAVGALEDVVLGDGGAERPLEGKQVLIIGANPAARLVACRAHKRGAVLIIAARDRDAGLRLAQQLAGRCIPFEALYTTLCNVLIVCGDEKPLHASKDKADEAGIHPGFLTSAVTVMDLTALPRTTGLLQAAKSRGCRTVCPRRVFLDHLLLQVRAMCERQVPREPLEERLRFLLEETE